MTTNNNNNKRGRSDDSAKCDDFHVVGFEDDDVSLFDFSALELQEDDKDVYSSDDFGELFGLFDDQSLASCSNNDKTKTTNESLGDVGSAGDDDDEAGHDRPTKKQMTMCEPTTASSSSSSSSTSLQSPSPSFIPQHKPILLSSRRMVDFFNAGDMEGLKTLIDEDFTDDCALLTQALQEEVYGKKYILEMFDSMARSVPDFCFVLKTVKYNPLKGIITVKAYVSGTRQFEEPSMYLYASRKNCEVTKEYYDIVSKGMMPTFVSQVSWYMILNKPKTKCQKLVIIKKRETLSGKPAHSY